MRSVILPAVSDRVETPDWTELVGRRLALPGGDLRLLQPSEAAELPDDGPVEWAPLLPYSWVLWRSGVALAADLEGEPLAGRTVVELGCGLGLPSLVAARAGATVLATDEDPDALALVELNARENDLAVATAPAAWGAAEELVTRGPFDLVLAADVLYEPESVASLLALLPRLGREVILADPGRSAAGEFLGRADREWSVATGVRDGIDLHRLTLRPTAVG